MQKVRYHATITTLLPRPIGPLLGHAFDQYLNVLLVSLEFLQKSFFNIALVNLRPPSLNDLVQALHKVSFIASILRNVATTHPQLNHILIATHVYRVANS
jgi:hypothetical protein